MLKEGLNFKLIKIVDASETAAKVASGALEVFFYPIIDCIHGKHCISMCSNCIR